MVRELFVRHERLIQKFQFVLLLNAGIWMLVAGITDNKSFPAYVVLASFAVVLVTAWCGHRYDLFKTPLGHRDPARRS